MAIPPKTKGKTMEVITKAQRIAIKRVFDRCPLYFRLPYNVVDIMTSTETITRYKLISGDVTSNQQYKSQVPLTYRQFRKRIQYGYDCIMVQWCGMWLGIETDGYTHS